MFVLRVDQANLLRRAIRPFANMGDRANMYYTPSFVILQAENRDSTVTALFVIKTNLTCNKPRSCFGINPIIMYDILNFHVGGEWSVRISGDADDRMMHFTFMNDTHNYWKNHGMYMLNKAPHRKININQFKWMEFIAVVGLRSGDFQNNLMLLSDGVGLMVNVYITHSHLKLSTTNKEIVLSKENGECIIGGVEENEEPFEFSFSLEQLSAYHNASVMSSMVWILMSAGPADPFVLNCPVGLLGNIMFIFPSNLTRENSSVAPHLFNWSVSNFF